MQASRLLAAVITVCLLAPLTRGQYAGAESQRGNPTNVATRADGLAPNDAPGRREANYTRRPDFFIPFEVAPNAARPPAEVRLYVSSDQGKDWTMYQSRTVDAKKFQFQATTDGEYWFAVRTADQQGQLIAHTPFEPELMVIVDSQRPRLEIEVVSNNYGDVTVDWTAEDLHLAASAFRLQYRDPQTRQWRDVQVRTPDPANRETQWSGTAKWWLQPRGEQVLIRAEVADRASNLAVVEKNVSLSLVADTTKPATNNVPDDTKVYPETAPIREGDVSARTPWIGPIDQIRESLPAWLSGPTESTDRADGLVESPVAPPVSKRQSSPNVQPLSQRPRITASPNFELSYDLVDVGTRGARTVELWYTADRGRTWAAYGTDKDAKSPVEVRLDREGVYGFRLVVYGYDTPAPRPPQDGEDADIWVAVDWTKPLGSITDARYGTGADRTTLIIEWQAEDVLLEERPINLSISETPQGPWTAIASALPNSVGQVAPRSSLSTGTYRWRFDRQTPPQRVFVRLEVRDMAGNVTTHSTSQPVYTQSQAPKGRIRDVRPVGSSESGQTAKSSETDLTY